MPNMTPRAKNLALMLLAMTQFVIVIDASIVNIALPSIGRALSFSQADLSWVVNAYTLTFGGFLLLGGRLADLMGRRRMFIVGLLLFSAASLAGGLAQSEPWLIAARGPATNGPASSNPASANNLAQRMFNFAVREKAALICSGVSDWIFCSSCSSHCMVRFCCSCEASRVSRAPSWARELARVSR